MLLAAATVACLVPFLGKAFHIDDPLFLWIAERIRESPTDPYGFRVIWYFWPMDVADITKNPPLASYWIAISSAAFGTSEIALHAAFLPAALAVVLGTHRLAGLMGGKPWIAGVAALVTPVFLVSSTTVMCDILMLALWVWAVVMWIEGVDRGDRRRLGTAATLVALAALAKYFAVVLLPLLAIYPLARRRAGWTWCALLLLPIAVLVGYHAWTAHLYGRGHLLDAAGFLREFASARASWSEKALTGLAFTGGCLAIPLTVAPLLWHRVPLALAGVAVAGAVALVPASVVNVLGLPASIQASPWDLRLQFWLWIAVGIGVLVLVFEDLRHARDARSLLLAGWVIGTFIFAAFVNWTVNARSVLPMVPAVGILLARRLEVARWGRPAPAAPTVAMALVLAGLLAFAVTWADARLAGSAREASEEIRRRYSGAASHVWFQGHWGFQYYMQRWGAAPVNFRGFTGKLGDLVIVPRNNSNVVDLPVASFPHVEALEFHVLSWVTTMSPDRRAGFYADVVGPLPFAFGPVPKEAYDVVRYAGPVAR